MIETILIVSDLHLGAGEHVNGRKNLLEDFHFDEEFQNFLQWKASQFSYPIELMIVGDAFDFPQVLPEINLIHNDPRIGATQRESLVRMEKIIQGHRVFFQSLRDFLNAGHIIRFLRGNHDIDLIWPDVQTRLRHELGDPCNLIFEKSHIYRHRGLYCEHGNQYSAENSFTDPYHPITQDCNGIYRLERCWGTYFIDTVYNDIETRFPIIDNIEDGQLIRGVLLAIKSDKIHFTGKIVGRILKIAFQAGLPLIGWTKSGLMGSEIDHLSREDVKVVQIESPEALLKNIGDQEASEKLLRRYQDESDFRRGFDSEINDFIREQAEHEFFFLPRKENNQLMGLLIGKNSYQRAAETILRKESVKIVLFGHTHSPVNGNFVSSSGGKYFNSGSWTSFIDIDDVFNRGKNFDELCNSGISKDSLNYVEVTIAPNSDIYAEMGNAKT